MPPPQKTFTKSGLPRLLDAFRHSRAGLIDIWKSEEAFRIEAVLFVLSIPVAIWIGDTVSQTLLLIGSLLFLIIVEILNTAIEAVVDRIGTERHELSRTAKDLGSAAVLLSACFPAAVWITIFLDMALATHS